VEQPIKRPQVLHCERCGTQQTMKLIYSLPEVAWLVGRSISAIKGAMERGDLKFRYRYQDGKAHKMVDYFQLWDYITERLPTPEELQSGDENVTKRAIKKYLAWYARLAVRGVEGRERAKAARAAEQQNGEEPSI